MKKATSYQMESPIISLLCLIVFFVLLSTKAFAGAIPGVAVGSGKSSGGGLVSQTKTDRDGKFSMILKEGSYTLNLSYDDCVKYLTSISKDKATTEVTIKLEGTSIKLKNGSTPSTIVLNGSTGTITFTVPSGGATLKGTLTYAPK
ncbi:MAG: hypothetical protein NTY07_06735 [Bacteroidia bacterium]|nr:hypothetical protein [Bacteroidia bacterium]